MCGLAEKNKPRKLPFHGLDRIYGIKSQLLVAASPVVDLVVTAVQAQWVKIGESVGLFLVGTWARYFREAHTPSWKRRIEGVCGRDLSASTGRQH